MLCAVSVGREYDLCCSFFRSGQKAETALCCEVQIVLWLSSVAEMNKSETATFTSIKHFRVAHCNYEQVVTLSLSNLQ